MRATFGPAQLVVRTIEAPFEFTAYRIVRSDIEGDPVLLNSFRSHYELGEEPRKVERNSAVTHMGISVHLERQLARDTAVRFSKLGGYIARLAMRAGQGLNFAQTGHPLHLTIWGDPIKLSEAVVDITPVDH